MPADRLPRDQTAARLGMARYILFISDESIVFCSICL